MAVSTDKLGTPEKLHSRSKERGIYFSVGVLAIVGISVLNGYFKDENIYGAKQALDLLNTSSPPAELSVAHPKTENSRLKPLPTPSIGRANYDRVWPGQQEKVVDADADWASEIALRTTFVDLPGQVDDKEHTLIWIEHSKIDARQDVFWAVMHLLHIGVDKNLIENRLLKIGNVSLTNRPASYYLGDRLAIGQNPSNPLDVSTIIHEIYHGFFEVDIPGLNEAFAAWQQMETGYTPPHTDAICGTLPEQFDYLGAANSLKDINRQLEQKGKPNLGLTMIKIYQYWLDNSPGQEVGDEMTANYFFGQVDKIYNFGSGGAQKLFFSKPTLQCGFQTATPETPKPYSKIPPKGKTPTPAQQKPK